MSAGKVYHVISNTHWDREWRLSYQRNRQNLVDMMDQAIDLLEREPEYRAFHLDSQAIVLRDYLEVRPDRRPALERLLREGRLLAGPWYVLPDEFQVGGENLVRNLLLGHRVCRELGGVSKLGYSPFSWGQISQLPQLYTGFGIDVVMFYRGINAVDSPQAEFVWEGADGTRVLASRFSTMPRYNFYFYVYRPVALGEMPADVERSWDRGGVPFHFADAEQRSEDYGLLAPGGGYRRELLRPQVEALIRDQAGDFTTPHVLWMEGHDSSGSSPDTLRILRDLRQEMPELRCVHSTLTDYARLLKQEADPARLSVVRGERRSAQADRRSGNLYGYTTSARMDLKLANFDAERWLQFYAEPFDCFTAPAGNGPVHRYLDLAWELVLQNSAHDSIGGCSLDPIHQDMLHRYRQASELARGVFDRAVRRLSRRLDVSRLPGPPVTPADVLLLALNPGQRSRGDVLEAWIDLPVGWPPARSSNAGAAATQRSQPFSVVDSQGRDVPVQLVSAEDSQPVLEQLVDRPMYFAMRTHRCWLRPAAVPPHGYEVLRVLETGGAAGSGKAIGSGGPGLPVLDNGLVRVAFAANGTFAVEDRQSGRTFRGLGLLLDEGEAGHAWVHSPVGPVVTTARARPSVSLVENGPLAATCEVRHVLRLPANLAERRLGKTGRRVKLPVTLRACLKAGARRVELSLEVDNTAESHRLRLVFPTGLNAAHSHGEGQFDVVARPVARPDTSGWLEQPMADYPLHHFVDLSDGEAGAAVLVDGLKEYEVLDDGQGTLLLTLLRGFEYVIQPASRQDYSHLKGSQCLGRHTFRLAFLPHRGGWHQGDVYHEALEFNNPVRLAQFGAPSGDAPPAASYLELEPPSLIFSCFKRAEDAGRDAFVLRLYNPGDEPVSGRVRTLRPLARADQVTLEETDPRPLALLDARTFGLELGPRKLGTYRLEFRY